MKNRSDVRSGVQTVCLLRFLPIPFREMPLSNGRGGFLHVQHGGPARWWEAWSGCLSNLLSPAICPAPFPRNSNPGTLYSDKNWITGILCPIPAGPHCCMIYSDVTSLVNTLQLCNHDHLGTQIALCGAPKPRRGCLQGAKPL